MALTSLAALLFVTTSPDAGVERTLVMHHAFEALVQLQPTVASPRAFREAAQGQQISDALQTLSQVEHGVLAARPQDPGARAIARVLTMQIARARASISAGDPETARGVLRGVSSLCFSCHTLEPSSSDFKTNTETPIDLTPLERASFLAATRRFDDALALWLATLAQPAADEQQATDAINGLRQALVVSVVVKDDPNETLRLIDAHEKNGGQATFFSHQWWSAWRAETNAWQSERFDARQRSPRQLFVRGKALVDESHAAEHILADETKTVGLLRATAYLTQAITREPRAAWRPEALYALGVATATVREPTLWGLDTVYFDACIRENPGSVIARRCFVILRDRTLFGFTGSSGTHLPPDVEARLIELAKLAALPPVYTPPKR